MDPYTKDTLPGTGGYTPAPAQQIKPGRYRRSLATLFRTSRRFRYLVCAGIVAVGAVTVPTVGHLLTKPQPQVLEAARTLPAGHVIAPGDLVPVTGRPQGASLIPAGQQAALLGRQLQLEVPAGALLAPGDFGPFPPSGMTVVPVAVKPGQYPPTLTGGDQVAVFPTPGASGGTAQIAAHAAATGRVVQLQAASDSSGTMVVLLETSTAQAPVIAQAPGVVLVALDAAGDAP
jgi:hypothetical protein